MSRQTTCAITLEHCQDRRVMHSKSNFTETTALSSCEPTLNTDTFDYDENGKEQPHVP